MEEKGHELHQVILDIAVSFLKTQDAWREVRFVLIAPQHHIAIPGEEAKLEQVLGDHHDLQDRALSMGQVAQTQPYKRSPTSVKTMAVIQKRLLGLGMVSMAHRKMSTGSTREAAEAVTMWLRMMMK